MKTVISSYNDFKDNRSALEKNLKGMVKTGLSAALNFPTGGAVGEVKNLIENFVNSKIDLA
jgi:hypothetical protein